MAIRSKKKKKDAESAVALKSYATILSPIVTEKTALISGNKDRAVFKVAPGASKDEIKLAVEQAFKVKVIAVNTVNVMGKVKRTTGIQGRRPGYKKAYITVAEGQKIEVVEGL